MRRPGTAERSESGPAPRAVMLARWILALALAILAFLTFRLAAADLARQALLADARSLQTGGKVERAELLDATRALADHPFKGAMADVRADVLALISVPAPEGGVEIKNPPSVQEIIGEYGTALSVRPYDGYLWARYSAILANLDNRESRSETLAAMKRALALSPRDYNTMRIVAAVGVRRWPDLECADRGLLMDMLEYAAAVDDRLLSRWNTIHGQSPMKEYLGELYARYGFDPGWARINASQCPRSG